MSTYHARSYAGALDLPALISFAERVTAAQQPAPAYYHPGDFVWQLAPLGASDDVRVWLDGDRVVACAIFEPPITFQFDVDTAREDRALFADIIRWIEDRHVRSRGGESPIAYAGLHGALSTWAFEHDTARAAILEELGFTRAELGGIRYAQPLDGDLPSNDPPAGTIVRNVTHADIEERIALHRDAWSVWGTSTFSAEQYARLRAAPLYDAELDVVVEFEGRLVSYCVCWMDKRNGVGYFEPVGTRPAFAGRGLGRAAMLGGLARLRDRGMTIARVGTASINTSAQALYRSAGFLEEAREFCYSKQRRGSE